jgi:hypothetical protein
VAREYTRLLADYTSLEGSRRRAAEGALVSQQRQRDLIDTLTRENEALKAELDLCRLSRMSETAPAMSVSLHDQREGAPRSDEAAVHNQHRSPSQSTCTSEKSSWRSR